MAETFGNTHKGQELLLAADNQWICEFTSGSAGEIESLTMYVKYNTEAGKMKCAIYDSSYNLLANGATEEKDVLLGQDDWMIFDFGTKPSVAATTVYFLAWWFNVNVNVYGDVADPWQTKKEPKVYNSWDDPIVTPQDFMSYAMSIYATYYEAPPPPAVKTLVQACLI